MSNPSPTRQRIKEVLVESLNLEISPDELGDDTHLWAGDLGLDSVDALELMVALEREYGFRIDSEEIDQESLTTVANIEAFVDSMRAAQPVG